VFVARRNAKVMRSWQEVSRSASVAARFRVPRIGSTRMSGDFHPQRYVYETCLSLCVSCECDQSNESMEEEGRKVKTRCEELFFNVGRLNRGR